MRQAVRDPNILLVQRQAVRGPNTFSETQDRPLKVQIIFDVYIRGRQGPKYFFHWLKEASRSPNNLFEAQDRLSDEMGLCLSNAEFSEISDANCQT